MATLRQPPAPMFIPPPPLPEFYLPKKAVEEETSSASSISNAKVSEPAGRPFPQPVGPVLQIPGTTIEPNGYISLPRKYPPVAGDGADKMSTHHSTRHSLHHSHYGTQTTGTPRATSTPFITIPSPPPICYQNPYHPPPPPPLAIYHICRICLRPRSARYHTEHPIPINGLPPPPGICRRCRVMSVEEKTTQAKYVTLEQSEDVKLGVKCLVNEDDVISHAEMMSRRAEKKYREQRRSCHRKHRNHSSSDSDVPEEIVYRYIEVDKSVTEAPPKQDTTKPDAGSIETDPISGALLEVDNPEAMTKVKISRRTRAESSAKAKSVSHSNVGGSVRASEVDKLDTAKASMSVHSSKSSHSAAQVPSRVNNTKRRDYSESEIRVFARDEVERYRQAERKIAGHPEAYAHGRMVPVQRRIEVSRAEVQPKPWTRPPIEASKTHPPKPWEAPPQAQPRRESVYVEVSRREQAATQPINRTKPEETSGPAKRQSVAERKEPAAPKPVAASVRKQAEDERTTTASIKGTNHSSSEDSRFWYKGATNDRPTERGVVESASRSGEHVRWTVTSSSERERRPRPTTESDPPVSAKLLEVRGEVRERPGSGEPVYEVQRKYRPSQAPESRGAPPRLRNIVEVIEEVELPSEARRATKPPAFSESRVTRREPPVSDRVAELQADFDRQQYRQKRSDHGGPSGQNKDASVRSIAHSDRVYWQDERAIHTANPASSKCTETLRTDRNADGPPLPAERAQPVLQHDETEGYLTMPSPSRFVRRPSDGESWYASRVDTVGIQRQANKERPREATDGTPYRSDRPTRKAASPREDDDKTIYPSDDTPIVRSDRPAPRMSGKEGSTKDGCEYIYTERTVQPADRPRGNQPFDEAPPRYYYESEEMHRRGHRPSEQIAPTSQRELPPSQPKRSSLTPPGRGRQGPYIHSDEQSAHVRFASKVEFSPTPPGSDDYPPTQRSRRRRQMDGTNSSDRGEERLRYPTEMDDRRGRTRDRQSREQQYDYFYERKSAASREREAELERNQRLNDEERVTDQHSYRLRENRGQRRYSDEETATILSRSRPLGRALSESPSREKLLAEAKRQEAEEAEYRSSKPQIKKPRKPKAKQGETRRDIMEWGAWLLGDLIL